MSSRIGKGPWARALGAALVSVGLWASAFVGIRSAVHEVAPGALALGRLLVGCVILGSVVLLRCEPLPPRRSLPGIVVSGGRPPHRPAIAARDLTRRIPGVPSSCTTGDMHERDPDRIRARSGRSKNRGPRGPKVRSVVGNGASVMRRKRGASH